MEKEELEVVQKYLNNEGGYRYLSEIYGTTHNTIKKWVLQYQYHDEEGLLKKLYKLFGSV